MSLGIGWGGGEEGEGILTLAYDGQDMYVQDWEHKTFKSLTTCFSFNNQFLNVNLIDLKKLNNIITGNKYLYFHLFSYCFMSEFEYLFTKPL